MTTGMSYRCITCRVHVCALTEEGVKTLRFGYLEGVEPKPFVHIGYVCVNCVFDHLNVSVIRGIETIITAPKSTVLAYQEYLESASYKGMLYPEHAVRFVLDDKR